METTYVSTSKGDSLQNRFPGTPKTNRGCSCYLRYIICLRY